MRALLVAPAIATALALAWPLAAPAQSAHAAHHPAPAAGAAQAPMTQGVVKRVDKPAGSITIAHEPLANLQMPAMTMTFLVKDRSWLDAVKTGSKVRFTAESVKGELVVVALEQAR